MDSVFFLNLYAEETDIDLLVSHLCNPANERVVKRNGGVPLKTQLVCRGVGTLA